MHGHQVKTAVFAGQNPNTNEIEETTDLVPVMNEDQTSLLATFADGATVFIPIKPAQSFELIAGDTSMLYRGINMDTFEDEDAPVTGVVIVREGLRETLCLGVNLSTGGALVPIKAIGEFDIAGLSNS